MDEDEHEVYGGEIPDEVDMDAAESQESEEMRRLLEEEAALREMRAKVEKEMGVVQDGVDMDADVDISRSEEGADKSQEMEELRRRLKDLEEAAAALREMKAKVEKKMGAVQVLDQLSSALSINQSSKEEADSRSVFVGNVDYACTLEEVQQHFQSCGTINRVTILTDRSGQPKGFAYVEFLEVEAVQEAFQLHESELHGRLIKVAPKRTNVPGLKQHPPGHNPYMTYPYSRPYMPPPYSASPYGYGRFPRCRRPLRYTPYF